jgi:hypothetical protein
MRNPLLPKQADNNHNLSRVIVIAFALITLVTFGRSLAHMFLPDGGANAIATIISFEGTPDPDAVIYNIFALWGLAQLAMAAMYAIVLFRYRNLIPLMWVFILAEYIMRIVIGRFLKPMGGDYFVGTAPGAIGNLIFMPLALTMLVWALAGKKARND